METNTRFPISPDTARFCKEYGLLSAHETDDTDKDISRLGLIHTLLEAGAPDPVVKRYLDLLDVGEPGRLERVRILKAQRAALLEHIHEKQRVLDQVDYLIWEQGSARKEN